MAEVRLFKQSLKDLLDTRQVFMYSQNIESLCMVYGASSINDDTSEKECFEKVNQQMIEKTKDLGGNYIVGIDYKIVPQYINAGGEAYLVFGSGDAYRILRQDNLQK